MIEGRSMPIRGLGYSASANRQDMGSTDVLCKRV